VDAAGFEAAFKEHQQKSHAVGGRAVQGRACRYGRGDDKAAHRNVRFDHFAVLAVKYARDTLFARLFVGHFREYDGNIFLDFLVDERFHLSDLLFRQRTGEIEVEP